jgi:hypothetical protein
MGMAFFFFFSGVVSAASDVSIHSKLMFDKLLMYDLSILPYSIHYFSTHGVRADCAQDLRRCSTTRNPSQRLETISEPTDRLLKRERVVAHACLVRSRGRIQ